RRWNFSRAGSTTRVVPAAGRRANRQKHGKFADSCVVRIDEGRSAPACDVAGCSETLLRGTNALTDRPTHHRRSTPEAERSVGAKRCLSGARAPQIADYPRDRRFRKFLDGVRRETDSNPTTYVLSGIARCYMVYFHRG